MALLGSLLYASVAFSQTVQQSGSVTPGHIATWSTDGVIQDGGTTPPTPSAGGAGGVSQSGNVTAGHITTWSTDGVIQDGGAVTANDSLSGGSTTSITSGQTYYCSTAGCATTTVIASVVPFTGTALNLNANVAVAPGTAHTVTATLYAGPYGALVATSLTCQITGSATSCQDTTHQVNVPAGQAWAVQYVVGAAATSTGGEGYGFQFVSSTPPTPTSPYVLQSGDITSGHIAIFTTNGVIQDGGAPVTSTIAPGPFVSSDVVCVNNILQLATCGPVSGQAPQAPTASPGSNNTQIATTSFVATSFAPLASPALTGIPTAPTAAAGTNTTQLATTAFVQSAISGTTPCDIKADNSTDNSAVIAACITVANVTGNTAIVFPPGIALAPTLAATISGANVWLTCPSGPGSCVLRGGLNNMLTWNNGTGGGGLFNMGIDNSGAATNTSVVLAVPSAFPVQFLNVVLSSGVGRFVSSAGATIYIRNMTGQVAAVASTPVISGVGGSLFLSDSSFYTVGVYPPPAGRNVINLSGNFDSIQITNNFFQIFDVGLNVSIAAGIDGSNVWLLGNTWDSILTSTVHFDVAATGLIERVHLFDRWMTSGSGPVINFSGLGTANNIQISASIPKAGSSGIIFSIAAANDIEIFGTVAVQLNNAAVSGTADGINIAGGANYKNISIIGNSIGSSAEGVTQPKNGCIFGAAIDRLTFANNDCQGTTANYNGMVAGTASLFAHTNVVQFGNVGLVNNAATFAANAQTALVVQKDDGTNQLTFSGSNDCSASPVPCIRSDNTQLVINSAAAGSLWLNLDRGLGINLRNQTAPSAPGAGFVTFYSDTTDLRFHDKNAAGTVGTTVVPQSGAFVTGVNNNGTLIVGTAGQFLGTATNDNASAGNVGEYVTSAVAFSAAVNILAPGWKTVTSITLTAGDWNVWAILGFEHDTAQQSINSNISQIGAAMTIGTANTTQPADAGLITTFAGNGLFNQAQTSSLTVGPMRFTCTASTCSCAATGAQDCGSGTGLVINMNGYCGGTGPCVGFGRLQARRAR